WRVPHSSGFFGRVRLLTLSWALLHYGLPLNSTRADLIGLTFGGCYNTPTWLIGDKSRPASARPKIAPTLPRNFPNFFSAPATRWSRGNSAPSKKKRNTPAKPPTGTPLARCPGASPDFEFEGAPSSLVLRGWGFFPVFPDESI